MAKQLLHLVLGGKVMSPDSTEFIDTDAVDIVGLFPDYQTALDAWREAAFATIDDAETRYFIVHLHRLLEPDEKPAKLAGRAAGGRKAS